MAVLIPLFYLHTAPDILAIPEAEPQANSTKILIYSVPSLELTARRSVVTVMISGTVVLTKVISSGEIITYSTALYVTAPTDTPGIIYVRQLPGNSQEERRADLLESLNTPDYEVIRLADGILPVPLHATRRIVHVADGAMLRIPVREIVRQFSSIFSSASTVIAPSVATFSNFQSGPTTTTTFISLSDQSHILLGSGVVTSQQSLMSSLPPLTQGPLWQPPIKMSIQSWIVFVILWIMIAVAFVISIGTAYRWYIAQYI